MNRPPVEMLLCDPAHFDVVYSINPRMDPSVPVNRPLALQHWADLRSLLQELSVRVQVIDGVVGLPDMVFAGDAGAVLGRRFIASSFRHPERAPEADAYRAWFTGHGYDVVRLPDGLVFEGLGDVVLMDGRALAAHGPRTDPAAIDWLCRHVPELNVQGTLELVDDRFFHIGIALAWLDARTLMYAPEAFSAESVLKIQSLAETAIALGDEDVSDFVINAIVLGHDLVVHRCSRRLRAVLTDRGFRVHESNVSEFVKSGGATRCMVLPLT
jgi:N-dimethylarginine dimethylaminohydrolase